MDSHWYAYVAGFFDGEGSISIVRNRSDTYSDYHKIVVAIGQRSEHSEPLDRICAEFGGKVALRMQASRVNKLWAEHSVWQLQSRPLAAVFLTTIQPYVRIKAAQLMVALEFVATFDNGARPIRDTLGRIRGKMLSAEEIQNRERLRLELRALNTLGPPHVPPSQLEPLDLRHRQTAERFEIDLSTVERGVKRYNAKLTDDAIRAIRASFAEGQTKAELARQHGVSYMLISGIVRRTRWRHVPDVPSEGGL